MKTIKFQREEMKDENDILIHTNVDLRVYADYLNPSILNIEGVSSIENPIRMAGSDYLPDTNVYQIRVKKGKLFDSDEVTELIAGVVFNTLQEDWEEEISSEILPVDYGKFQARDPKFREQLEDLAEKLNSSISRVFGMDLSGEIPQSSPESPDWVKEMIEEEFGNQKN